MKKVMISVSALLVAVSVMLPMVTVQAKEAKLEANHETYVYPHIGDPGW